MASDRRERAAKGLLWLVNQRYGKLILPAHETTLSLNINMLRLGHPEFAAIQNNVGRHSDRKCDESAGSARGYWAQSEAASATSPRTGSPRDGGSAETLSAERGT